MSFTVVCEVTSRCCRADYHERARLPPGRLGNFRFLSANSQVASRMMSVCRRCAERRGTATASPPERQALARRNDKHTAPRNDNTRT